MKNTGFIRLQHFLCMLLLTCSLCAGAGVNPSYTVAINHPAFGLDYKIEGAKLFVRLSAENATGDYYYGSNVFDASVDIQINAYDQNNAIIPNVFTSSNPIKLTINQNKPELVFYKEFTLWLNAATKISKFEITTSGLVKNAADSKILTALNNDLQLDVTYNIDYGVNTKLAGVNKTASIINLATRATNPLPSPVGQRVIDFSWNNNGNLFPNYQFQLLKLSNTDATLYTTADPLNEQKIKTTIDWSKALTIETQSAATSLSLSMAEATGYYVWRVRPIGTYYPGGIADSRNWGQWSNTTIASEGSPVQFNANLAAEINNALPAADFPFFFFKENDAEPNRIYSRTFSEENKISEQMTYANGLMQVKQSQSYLPSMDALVVSQTLNDFSGRPTLTTLPVPFVNQKLAGYKQGFVKTPGNKVYTAADYDLDGNLKDPAKVNDAAGQNFEYYSGSHLDTKGNVPGAEGYAYSRTIFYNDGTGRVKEVAGPGARHALGDQAAGRGRTTRTLYSTPSDEELIRVFGDEAPDASRVLKTLTIDQNNTTSISYSTEGRVIATCIAKNTTENSALLSLTDPALPRPENALNITVNDAVKQSIPSSTNFKSIKRLAFSQSTAVQIKYLLNCGALASGCATADCDYDLKIAVINIDDLTDAATNLVYTQTLNSGNCVSQSNGKGYLSSFIKDGVTVPSPINLTLPAGSYIIEKTLIPKKDAEETGKAAFNNSGKEVQCYVNLILHWLENVTTPELFTAFSQKLSSFPGSMSPQELNDYFTSQSVTPSGSSLQVTLDANGKPEFLLLSTSCCPNMKVALSYTPPYTCPADLSLAAHYTGGGALDFEGYAAKILGTPLNYSEMFPGYAPGDFNAMIKHMLTDQYKCSPADATATTHYTCEQLWSCWVNIVSGYVEMKNGLDGTYSAEGGKTDGTQGGADADSPGTADHTGGDDVFNSNNNGMLQKIIGKWMNRYMRKKELKKTFSYNLSENFLLCTGYQFAEILAAPNGNPTIITNDGYAAAPVSGSLPNIKKPIFAFKYFVYADGSNPACESANCYTANTSADPCKPIKCTAGKESWNCQKRYNFYSCIISNNSPVLVADDAEDPVLPDAAALQALADQKNNVCNSTCDDRKGEFRETLINLFQASCYTIGGCATDLNNVSYADIDKITNDLVTECKTGCTVTPPACALITCGANKYLQFTWDDCKLLNMERVMTSRLEINIVSKCAGAPPYTCVPVNNCIPGAEVKKELTVTGQ